MLCVILQNVNEQSVVMLKVGMQSIVFLSVIAEPNVLTCDT